jgi:hypothetical protein
MSAGSRSRRNPTRLEALGDAAWDLGRARRALDTAAAGEPDSERRNAVVELKGLVAPAETLAKRLLWHRG